MTRWMAKRLINCTIPCSFYYASQETPLVRHCSLLLERMCLSSLTVLALLHAMRIGESHRDVAILLVGALSRYVNHLDEEDLQKPQTKNMLKALRT